jgi:hypothetical protein
LAPQRPGHAESFDTSHVSNGSSTMPSPHTGVPVGHVPWAVGFDTAKRTASLRLMTPPATPAKLMQYVPPPPRKVRTIPAYVPGFGGTTSSANDRASSVAVSLNFPL